MKFFFDTVQTFSTTGKTDKGKALQEMAKRLEYVLVEGDNAPFKIHTAMREKANSIDEQFPRGRKTFVDINLDRSGQYGQITAVPVSDSVDFDKQPYFRVYFHRVARTATIAEAMVLTKGGAL